MAVSSTSEIRALLPWKWRPFKRHLLPGCDFFADGDEVLRAVRKLVPVETISTRDCQSSVKEDFPCGVFGCGQKFSTLLNFENHYNSVHRHACSVCHRTFPSPFLLDIHLQEQHDSMFTVMAAKQNMYRCLVEQCEEKFAAPERRRRHLLQAHKYPANFRFHRETSTRQRKPPQQRRGENQMEVETSAPSTGDGCGIESPALNCDLHGGHSVLCGSASNKENTVAMETVSAEEPGFEGKTADQATRMELESGRSDRKLQGDNPRRVFVSRVPNNFSFGHGVARGFQRSAGRGGRKKGKGGHWHQRASDEEGRTQSSDISSVDMADIASALQDV